MRVLVGTWALNGVPPNQHKGLTEWLINTPKKRLMKLPGGDPSGVRPVDMYVVGLQEMVFPEQSLPDINQRAEQILATWGQQLQNALSKVGNYLPLVTNRMAGMCLYIFVRPSLIAEISDLSMEKATTGYVMNGDMAGAVAIRFNIFGTSVAFVTCNLNGGLDKDNMEKRPKDFQNIENISFPTGGSLCQQEYVFLLGKVNYRQSLPPEACAALNADMQKCKKKKDWAEMLSIDPLTNQKNHKMVLADFNEGPIEFGPTSKTNPYTGLREPSWTDRILWRRKDNALPAGQLQNIDQGILLLYSKANLKSSPHKPVVAMLDIPIPIRSSNTKDAELQGVYPLVSNQPASEGVHVVNNSHTINSDFRGVTKVPTVVDTPAPVSHQPVQNTIYNAPAQPMQTINIPSGYGLLNGSTINGTLPVMQQQPVMLAGNSTYATIPQSVMVTGGSTYGNIQQPVMVNGIGTTPQIPATTTALYPALTGFTHSGGAIQQFTPLMAAPSSTTLAQVPEVNVRENLLNNRSNVDVVQRNGTSSMSLGTMSSGMSTLNTGRSDGGYMYDHNDDYQAIKRYREPRDEAEQMLLDAQLIMAKINAGRNGIGAY